MDAALDQIRPLTAEVGTASPLARFSALFPRGETQAVALATLAPTDEAQDLDGYTGGETTKRFILHYNFPPFSVGETGRTGSPGRREIGHGALAERSSSRSSRASRTSPTPSAFRQRNHGVQRFDLDGQRVRRLSRPHGCRRADQDAASRAFPSASSPSYEGEALERYSLLTDIIGSEDHFGDMDFKLCGTHDGVTGFQLDLKLPGISPQDPRRSHLSKPRRAHPRSSRS